ncbi:unnamed protein product, partial [Brassica napus]
TTNLKNLPEESLCRSSFASARLTISSSKTLRIHLFISIKNHLSSFNASLISSSESLAIRSWLCSTIV